MNDIKNRLKAIIFDMDGTIIKTEHVWNQPITQLLANHNISIINAEQEKSLASMVGMNLKEASVLMKKAFDLSSSVEDIYAFKLKTVETLLSQRMEYIPGFENFHAELRHHKIPSGIATNAHPQHLEIIKKTMQFSDIFGTHIYSVEHVGRPKPEPDLFLHTAYKLGVQPEDCIVFEDSLHGFNAAKAAGMKCILIKNETNKMLVDSADEAIDHYGEAIEKLKKIL